MARTISIIIPAFNQVDLCRQCIASIQHFTEPPYKLILVDNGSTDGAAELFDTIIDATVVHTGENLGFAGGVNAGMQHAEGDVLLLNSDTLTPKGWLRPMRRALAQDPNIGIVGPMSNRVSGAQLIPHLNLQTMDDIHALAQQRARAHAGELEDVPRVVGFCMLIRESCWREIGLLDERFGIGNFEDDDYCRRAVEAGFRICIARDSFVFHYGSRTFAGMGLVDDAWNALIQENQQRYEEKWQGQALRSVNPRARAERLRVHARSLHEKGLPQKALEQLKQAIATDPNHAMAYNDIGLVLWSLGQCDHAARYFGHALARDPELAEAAENLRMAWEAGYHAEEELLE